MVIDGHPRLRLVDTHGAEPGGRQVGPASRRHQDQFRALRRELLDRDVPADRKDAVLAALIRCGQRRPDDDARLAAIVCLLPGVRRIASRFTDILG